MSIVIISLFCFLFVVGWTQSIEQDYGTPKAMVFFFFGLIASAMLIDYVIKHP